MEKLQFFILMLIKQAVITLLAFFVLTFISVLMIKMLIPILGIGMWEIFVPFTVWAVAVPAMIAAQKPGDQRFKG